VVLLLLLEIIMCISGCYSQFGDDCLAATTAACPAIQSLVLASCPAVGPAGLLALKELPHLTVLDLSYTFLTDLSPIFEACPHLKVFETCISITFTKRTEEGEVSIVQC